MHIPDLHTYGKEGMPRPSFEVRKATISNQTYKKKKKLIYSFCLFDCMKQHIESILSAHIESILNAHRYGLT